MKYHGVTRTFRMPSYATKIVFDNFGQQVVISNNQPKQVTYVRLISFLILVLMGGGRIDYITLLLRTIFTAKTRHFQGYGLGDTKSVHTPVN